MFEPNPTVSPAPPVWRSRTGNPGITTRFFLFSDKSNGKTHLLHAVGNRILSDNPPQRVRYVRADQFTSQFSRALKDHQIHAFRNGYTDLDVLLFDDVDRLGGRVKTQEECTFLFDTLLRDGKTLLVASRLPPFRLTDVAPRLTSILTWGLLAEIHAPDTETRIRVVREHARREDCPLPDDIIFFLAKSNDDMKYLFGQIARLQTYASLSGARLDLSTVHTLIRDQTRKELEPEDIKAITAGYFKLLHIRPLLRQTSPVHLLSQAYGHVSLPKVHEPFP